LASASNSYEKTHPMQKQYAVKVGLHDKQYLHAEIHAILKLRRMGGNPHRMVVSRFAKDGSPASAKPCPICSKAILDFGIKIVEHT